MRSRTMLRPAMAGVATLLLASTACEKKAEPPPPPKPAPAQPASPATPAPKPDTPAPKAAVPAGPPGTIKGVVEFTGTAPKMQPLNRAADPYCAKIKMNDNATLVKKGKFQNVHVRIKGSVPGKYPVPAEKPVIKQLDCMFVPRVVGAMRGQTLQIENNDKTLHNVHTYKGASTWFNQAQLQATPPMLKKLDDDADMVAIKCDVHPWMYSAVRISPHPFFAVTGADGAFELADVPPGKYTLEAWHEKAGTKTVEVEVKSKATVEAKIAYAAADLQ